MFMTLFDETAAISAQIAELSSEQIFGRVNRVQGLMVEIAGLGDMAAIGTRLALRPRDSAEIPCEIVGFRDTLALAMPFRPLEGVGPGTKAILCPEASRIAPSSAWLGRVVNGLGQPIDGLGPLVPGDHPKPFRNTPPPAHQRQRMGTRLDTGVRAVNTFTTLCRGQRMGIFAGSGVGKSVLMSMMARYSAADVAVIGLVGERGREVQEFLEDDLGEDGLKRAVVVVSTSDEAPLMRRQAAYTTLALAEYYRDQGHQVLCMMDSVTRFAMSQREIGLSVGEPPTTKGYPPTTFSELARLLERAGPGPKHSPYGPDAAVPGSITGIFTVLVEGDDHNEPVSDAVRGIVDGHIVMQRSIADRGRFPAINVLKSISRAMPNCLNEDEVQPLRTARELLSTYDDMAELIRLGAYRKGSDPKVDLAIEKQGPLEDFLGQDMNERTDMKDSFDRLKTIVGDAGASGSTAKQRAKVTGGDGKA